MTFHTVPPTTGAGMLVIQGKEMPHAHRKNSLVIDRPWGRPAVGGGQRPAGDRRVSQVGSAQGSGSPLEVASSGDLGPYLAGADGRTLYFFVKDVSPGVSVCKGKCLEAWPPYLIDKGAKVQPGDGVTGVVDTFKRPNGSRQVSYDGRPLYYFANDAAAGDTNGQGVGGVWFVAAVDGSAPTVEYPLATATTDLESILTGEDGKALYFFKKDTAPGASTCTSTECLDEWPPYLLEPYEHLVPTADVTGVVATMTRDDGGVQVTYDGRPLYYFHDDTEAGVVTGQGKDQFFAALVDGSLSSAVAPAASPAAASPSAAP